MNRHTGIRLIGEGTVNNIYPRPPDFPFKKRPFCEPFGIPVRPRIFPEPIPLLPRPLQPYMPYGVGGISSYPISPPTDKIEATVDGVYIKIPKTKAGVALARDVLKLLEKQIQ